MIIPINTFMIENKVSGLVICIVTEVLRKPLKAIYLKDHFIFQDRNGIA